MVEYSKNFRKHLRDLKVSQSFSNPGTPLDNAVAKSFFTCMKREELSHNLYETREQLENDVAEYVEVENDFLTGLEGTPENRPDDAI